MSENNNRPQSRNRGAVWLEILGSMNLAITLLVAVSIASIIGTVLRQNQAYNDYLIKFGPFWFELFERMGMYDIYSSLWFLAIMGFLLTSTSVCLYRNAPTMLRDMRHFRLNVQEKSLRAFHHQKSWQLADTDSSTTETEISRRLEAQGYRLRRKQHDDHVLVAGVKGASNRLGYILAHASIVIICLGALVDGNLALKLAEMTGEVKIETRNLPASEVPAESVLADDSSSFRGNVTIPEGSSADLVFLNVRDGYLVQKLPFKIKLKDFRIEHYPSGQPKSFESDLIILDEEVGKPLEKTISVNHPWIYKGYAIYQASFADGGSRMQFRVWSLDDGGSYEAQGAVNRDITLPTTLGQMTMELNDFRKFNINPAPEAIAKERPFINHGPSLKFKLRDSQGQAREFENYMLPVDIEGRRFFVSGVRETVSEPMRFIHIPVDTEGDVKRFMAFRNALRDEKRVRKIAITEANYSFQALKLKDDVMRQEVIESMVRMIGLFNRGGYDAIGKVVEQVPEEKQQAVINAYIRILQTVLSAVYADVLREEGVDLSEGVSESDDRYYEEAVNAMSGFAAYGSPVFIQIKDFEHVEASGLQITRSPGKNTVYLGCVMLIVGIFFMFYIPHTRVWARIAPQGNGSEVFFAGSGNRGQREFDQAFEALSQSLDQGLKNR